MLSLRQKLFGSLSTPALQGGRVALRALALSLAVGGSAWASDVYADPVPGDGPALYAVRDADTTLYLYGTFHLLPPGTRWETEAFHAAMAETGHTFVEADVLSPPAQQELSAAVARLGMNPPGVTLSSILGPDRTANLESVLVSYGVPLEALEPMQPWLAILSLTAMVYGQAGLDPSAGIEPQVLARASAEGDSIGYLETATYQIEVLAGLDEALLLDSFDLGLEGLTDIQQQVLDGVEAWRTGDVQQLDEILVAEVRETSPELNDAVFTTRNENWADQIEDMLARNQDAFIAVGAGHLYGPGSVIDILVDRDVQVERVQ